MKAVIAASLIATASAFSTSQSPRSVVSTQLNAAMDDMVGSVDFRGKEFKFDPRTLHFVFIGLC
jgi:hypothetical protein